MFTFITTVIFMVIWIYGAGPFLLFLNAVAHSDTNLMLGYAKANGTSTVKLRIYQVLHCIGYIVWLGVFVSIPYLVKHHM